MIKKIFLIGSVILLSSLIAASFIFAEKNTPDEAVKRYWQYLLEKNCKKIDEMETDFTGYQRDEKGQIYRVQASMTANGKELSNVKESNDISNCYAAERAELLFVGKYFKILKSEVDEELQTAHITILTKDKNKVERKFKFSLSKETQNGVWKIIGFNMLIDEKDE